VVTHLERPVYGYLVLWNDKLYVIWGEFEDLPRNGRARSAEIEHKVLDVINKHSERVEVKVEEYEVDREYERLWLEIPLPKDASKLLGGKSKAPVALFRNLGWLLSDDGRLELTHKSGNPGQVAVRLFDWIAIAAYAVKGSSLNPFLFKLSVYKANRTKDGINPLIVVRPIGTVGEVVQSFYEQFGIALGKTEEVLAHGYAMLKALKEEAFKRDGKVYVVNDVGAWIAFSNAVAMLILGDGYVLPFELGVAAKFSPRTTFEGKTTEVRELANALGGAVTGKLVHLRNWFLRLLLPVLPMPIFEKTVKLYDALVNYPAAATVVINGATYLLTHNGSGRFVIGKEKATELYKAVKRLGLKVLIRKYVLEIPYTQLRELTKHVSVRLLNELEKDSIREVKPATSPDPETLMRVLEEVARIAKIALGLYRGREYVRIIPYDKAKLWEIAAALKAAGIRFSINRKRCQIYIHEQRSVEIICKIMSYLFPIPSSNDLHLNLLFTCM